MLLFEEQAGCILQVQKNNYLGIKFNDRNQVDIKIVWGQGGEFLSFHSRVRCQLIPYQYKKDNNQLNLGLIKINDLRKL